MDSTLPNVKIFTDGACIGNPGPGGWAYLIKLDRQIENSGGEQNTTNNRMEMTAAIRALEAIEKPHRIELYSDSEYLCKGIITWMYQWVKHGWRKTANAQTHVKNDDLWRKIWRLTRRHQVIPSWVKGHNGQSENERCDELARLAARRIADVAEVVV